MGCYCGNFAEAVMRQECALILPGGPVHPGEGAERSKAGARACRKTIPIAAPALGLLTGPIRARGLGEGASSAYSRPRPCCCRLSAGSPTQPGKTADAARASCSGIDPEQLGGGAAE